LEYGKKKVGWLISVDWFCCKLNMLFICLLFSILFVTSSKQLLGGENPLDVDNEKVESLAFRALQKENMRSNNLHHLVLIRVKDATSQVVAGINYKLTIYVGESECSKKTMSAEDAHQNRCKLVSGDDARLCKVTIHEKPWLNVFEVDDFECTSVPRAEALQA
ncbi:Onchocystatin, partial [Trichinella pseudospiralis]